MPEQAGLKFDRTGQWVNHVLDGADREQRRARLAEVPDLLRDAVAAAVKVHWGRRKRYTLPANVRWIPCRACRQSIAFVRTRTGKRMPINPDGSEHWSVCSKPEAFRK